MTKNRNTDQCQCGRPGCIVRSAADYPVEHLSDELRMIALLHAAGRDVSDLIEMIARDRATGGIVRRDYKALEKRSPRR